MSKLYYEQRFPRKLFGKLKTDHDIPYLLAIQRESYKAFLGEEDGKYNGNLSGISKTLSSIFPISSNSGSVKLEYLGEYVLEPTAHDIQASRDYGSTYEMRLKTKLRLTLYDRDRKDEKSKKIRYMKEEWAIISDIPIMTETGSFIINGNDRVVVSQLHRSPGVFFDHDKGRNSVGKFLYQSRIIPYRGSWLDFEFDTKDLLFFRIDRRKKLPATILLKALGMDSQEIINKFYEQHTFELISEDKAKVKMEPNFLRGIFLTFDIKGSKGETLVEKGVRVIQRHIRQLESNKIKVFEVDKEYLLTKALAEDIIDPKTGEILAKITTNLTADLLKTFVDKGIKKIKLIYTNDVDRGPYILKTLKTDHISNDIEALFEIYKIIRPGSPPDENVARNLFKQLFFDENRYSLSKVGRMKLNLSTNANIHQDENILTKDDILEVLRILISIRDGERDIDDVDNLGNRRVRTAGEMVENQLRMGLLRVERNIKEALVLAETENKQPQDFINSKAVTSIIKEFFATGQMSQFMDQNNPLAEITQKRRITALGPGGLSRERSGFEVRDVHPTHYGRLCPIETPEGPNIGLINSMASYAKLNEYGFLVTPYHKVENGKILKDEVVYCSVLDEYDKVIAEGDVSRNDKGEIAEGEMIHARYNHEAILTSAKYVDMIAISPKQIVSVAASLIPFLEHDDANRALMGSNMQRQATPLITPEKPLIGTGVEQRVAKDSGALIVAKRSGKVVDIDSMRIVIQANDENEQSIGADIYTLTKYRRTNQSTCFHQKAIVSLGDDVKAGDVIADGTSIDNGELALGQNVRIAFMSWNGYNFEDSILISERIVREERFSSIHIEELICISRSTKVGDEEITNEIPNVGESSLSKLDNSGIVYIGAKVKSGDILVGKITPKGESQHSPEEKLLKAIFGDKAADVLDTSLRVPPGMQGTVVDVQIYTRNKANKPERALDIEKEKLLQLKQDKEEEIAALNPTFDRLRKLLLKQIMVKGKEKEVITNEVLEKLSNDKLLEINIVKETKQIKNIRTKIKLSKKEVEKNYDDKKKVLSDSAELSPNVLQLVKVCVAVKRRIQPGDKMAGRHGNKGVISAIMAMEDMPYDENGVPVDIVLSPLGVPSRMNVGQIIETHLGAAAKSLGKQIEQLLNHQKSISEIKSYLTSIYSDQIKNDINSYTDEQVLELANNLKKGIPMATPVFNGATEREVEIMLDKANLPKTGKVKLYDGCTGEPFDQEVTVGYMYIMKLNHLVDDKMHARSTGTYSLVTQQPLGGKSQFGGQRFGEMEVWALEAYGAAYTLQEMLTVKSDDIDGRKQMYKCIIDGVQYHTPGVPESFNVLVREIRALCLDVDME